MALRQIQFLICNLLPFFHLPRVSSVEMTQADTWGSGSVWKQSSVRDAGRSHVHNIIKRRTWPWWRTWNGYKGGWASAALTPNGGRHISLHRMMDLLQHEDTSQTGPAPKNKSGINGKVVTLVHDTLSISASIHLMVWLRYCALPSVTSHKVTGQVKVIGNWGEGGWDEDRSVQTSRYAMHS